MKTVSRFDPDVSRPQQKTADPAILKFAAFTLDLAAGELRKGHATVPVDPDVFALIAYLARNARRVVPNDELFDAVWRARAVSDSVVSDSVATNAVLAEGVAAARRALDDDGARARLIEAIPDRGVRFRALPAAAPDPALETVDAAPFDIRYSRSADGATVGYADLGNGPPLVRAAGFPTHLLRDADSAPFRGWTAAFSERTRYVCYDERGVGLSDWSVSDLSLDAMVADLETVVDAAGLDRFAALGVSQGAAVAIAYAQRHPDRVSRLILSGGGAIGWRRGPEAAVRRRAALLDLLRVSWSDDTPIGARALAALFLPGASPDEHAAFAERLRAAATPEAVIAKMEAFADVDLRDALRDIRAPTLVLHAARDAVVPFENGRDLAAGIAGARLVALDGANHIVGDGDPDWPRFARAVVAFAAAPDAAFKA